MSALEGTKTTLEVLEKYGTIPDGRVDEETWWMEDSQRVRDLLIGLVCDELTPNELVPVGDGAVRPFRCGRHFFRCFGYRIRHKEQRAAKKAAIAQGLRDPSSDESEPESESLDEENDPPHQEKEGGGSRVGSSGGPTCGREP